MNNRLAVIYQFGKVASTSVVSTLDELEGVTAVQSHFLGKDALLGCLKTLTNPNVPDYFFEHQLGQLIDNARLSRRIDVLRAGGTEERLLVISMTRHPFDWFRSSVVQDLEGYLPMFRDFLDSKEIEPTDDDKTIGIALTHLFNVFGRIITRCGGVDQTLDRLKAGQAKVFAGSQIENAPRLQSFFYMALRPFDWFERHFETSLGVRIDDFTVIDQTYRFSDETGDFCIFRYEDMATALPACLEAFGVPAPQTVKERNVSAKKPFAAATKSAFQTPAAERLHALFLDTAYSRRFDYG